MEPFIQPHCGGEDEGVSGNTQGSYKVSKWGGIDLIHAVPNLRRYKTLCDVSCLVSCRFPVAVVLCDVLRATNREKVQRVIFATFRVYYII